MRSLLKRLILWALADGVVDHNDAADLDNLARSVRGS
jgi:hypothetical protein